MAFGKSATRRNASRDKRERNAIRALGLTAILLGVVALALLGVKLSEGARAGDNAEALLAAYKAKATLTPEIAEPTATPTSEPIETPAPEDENLEQTDASEDAAAAASADEHRASGTDIVVDESGEYIQPESPDEVTDLEATIEKIIAETGEKGVVGILEIPELNEELPIIGKWSYKLLKISICRYKGPDPNQNGNLVVIGHNYKNGSHFGRLNKLSVGSELFLTDTATGTRTRYEVYQIKSIEADAFSALEVYRGKCGLTLMTCKDNGTNRLLLRCEQKAADDATAAN